MIQKNDLLLRTPTTGTSPTSRLCISSVCGAAGPSWSRPASCPRCPSARAGAATPADLLFLVLKCSCRWKPVVVFGQRINKYLGLRPSVGPVKCSWTSGASPSPVTTKPCHSPAEHNESDITVAQSAVCCLFPTSVDGPGTSSVSLTPSVCTRPIVRQPGRDVWAPTHACTFAYLRQDRKLYGICLSTWDCLVSV